MSRTFGLTAQQTQILDFESTWPRHTAVKEEAIRDQLALTPARYYQVLHRLIDTLPAQQYDPLLVHRLQRIRAAVPNR